MRRTWIAPLLLGFAVSCRQKAEETRAPARAPERPLSERRLVTLLPPLRLSSAVYLRPRAIFEEAALRSLRETWVSSHRRSAFHRVTGVNLEELPEAWVVAYELGTLYLMPKTGAEGARQAFIDNSQFLLTRPTGHSRLKAWDGSFDDTPRSLVEGPYFVAFADRDPTLRRLVTERALGRLDHVPGSVQLAELARRLEARPRTLASILWRGSATDQAPPDSPTPSLSDSLLSIQADIEADDPAIAVDLELVGAFGGEEQAALEIDAWASAVLQRPELAYLGFDRISHAPASCRVDDELDVCQLLVRIDPEALNRALVHLMKGELSAY